MKVFYYTHQFGYTTQTFIFNEIQSLQKEHEVCIGTNQIFDRKGGTGNVHQMIHYEHPLVAKTKSIFNLLSPFKVLSFRQQWNEILDNFQPDLILIPFGTVASRVLEYHDWETKIPVLIVFHGYDASVMLNDKNYVRRLRKMMQRKEVSAAFVSKDMQMRMHQKGIEFNQEFVLYCGVNIKQYKRTDYEKTEVFSFLQVSSFADKKGHEYTLEAYAKFLNDFPVYRSQTRLIIGGDGDKMSKLKDMVRKLNIADNVIFKGWVTVDENVGLMNAAQCFLHHSVTTDVGDKEGIPTVVMEAMAMELPILSTRHSGIPELVEEGVHGYLVEERDVEKYAERMKDILDWDYKTENRRKVESLFSESKHAEDLYYIINELTNAKPSN